MKNKNVIYACWGALIAIYIISSLFAINTIDVTESDAAHFEIPESGTFGLTDGHDTITEKLDVYVYPLTRPEQVKLMGECIEDAIAVCQDANIYPIGNWYREDEIKSGEKQVILAAEIAVAFFNYRTRDK